MQDGPNPELRNETYQLSKPPRTPSEGLRQKLKWTHLSKRRDMFRLVLVHRCMNNRAPEYPGRSLNQTGNLDFEEHEDMTRCISIKSVKTEWGRRSFGFQAAWDWNNLPEDIREIRPASTFRDCIF